MDQDETHNLVLTTQGLDTIIDPMVHHPLGVLLPYFPTCTATRSGVEMTNNEIELQVLITVSEGMIAKNTLRVERNQISAYVESDFKVIA